MAEQELTVLIERYYEQMSALQQTVDSLQQQLADVPKKISHYDLIQSDLLHELELVQLNAVQGTKVLKELKNVRKERRLYKNVLLFSQQEQKNLQTIATLNVSTSPFQSPKTYTYRTEEGYAVHQSLQGKYSETQVIKPPKVKAAALELKEDDVALQQKEDVQLTITQTLKQYDMTRENQKWQLLCDNKHVVAFAQLKSMKRYLAEHAIVLRSVSQHEQLFEGFLVKET